MRPRWSTVPYSGGSIDVVQYSTRFADQDGLQNHFGWINGRNPGRIEYLLFQSEHQFLQDVSWSKLPAESERAPVRLRFVSNTASASAQATINKTLPPEADSSSTIAPQSAIVLSFDRRRVISSCKTDAVAFCTSIGTTLGM